VEVNARPYSGPRKEREGGRIVGNRGRKREQREETRTTVVPGGREAARGREKGSENERRKEEQRSAVEGTHKREVEKNEQTSNERAREKERGDRREHPDERFLSLPHTHTHTHSFSSYLSASLYDVSRRLPSYSLSDSLNVKSARPRVTLLPSLFPCFFLSLSLSLRLISRARASIIRAL